MQTDRDVDIQTVLLEWRTKILNGFLIVVTGIAAIMTVVTILDALSNPRPWSAIIIYVVMTLVVAGLAVFRKIDYRVRAWTILVICYIAGLITLATFGLGSAGRLYLLALPIFTLILIGTRPGISMSVISIITMTVFAFLADRGVLAQVFVRDRNSLLLADWLAEFADTVGILSVVMVLLVLFYGFQERLIARERHAQADLQQAHALLEQQNATLEQKVYERTSELQSSNHSLEQRNAALAILNSVSEAMTKTLDVRTIMRLVGDRIREIFDVDSSMIMLLDTQTNMIHVPYEYDRNEGGYIDYVEPFPLGTGLSSKVISTGQPLMVNTLEEEIANGAYFPPEIIAQGQGAYGQSWLGVPILASDQVLGLIALADNRAHVFSQNHMRLLQTLSSNLGAAIENANLFDQTQRLLKETEQRNRELAVINNVQQGLVSNLDVQSMIDLFGDELMRIFPPDESRAHNHSVFIALYDPQTDMIEFPYLIDGAGNRFTEPPTPLGPGLTSSVIRSGQALVLNTLEEQVAHGMILFTKSTVRIESQSWLGVPIRSGDRVIGVISMQDRRPHLFTESIVRLLSTMASSLGVALENARLFAETRQRNRELTIINRVQQALASKLDMQAIYELIGEKVQEVFHVDVVDIVAYDPGANIISMPYSYEKGDRSVITPRAPYGFRLDVIKSHESLLINEKFAELASQHDNPILTGTCPKSALFVPLMVDGNVRSIISIQDLERENAFSDSDVRLLQTLTNSMSIALENARLFDETQRLLKETDQRATELQIINSIQQGLAAELDFQAIVDLVGDKLREVFNAPDLAITWYDEKQNLVHWLYAYEHGRRYKVEAQAPNPNGFYETEMKTRQPVIFNSLADYAKLNVPTLPGTDQGKSYVSVPIISSDRFLGDIGLENFERESAFGESEIRLLTTIAASLGTALENARLFDETQRLFSETQQRATELQIINSVQAALAAELNIQGIYDAVGDKIREIFHGTDMNIRTYDPKTGMVHTPYFYENGERATIDPGPLEGLGFEAYVFRTRETVVINENVVQESEKYGSYVIPGTSSIEKSLVFVPLVVGDQARGLINLSNFEREYAFSESDVRLLETLANSMSVALENARLFNETQRLLKETEQHAAELATVNTISTALVRELDLSALITLAGEQIRSTFQADIVYVALLDKESNIINFPYQYGEHLDALTLGEGLTSRIIQTGRPLLVNQEMERTREQLGTTLVGKQARSYLGVPIFVGGETIGVVSVQSTTQEGLFTENDQHLLSTIAANVGIAIQNARLFDEIKRQEHYAQESQRRLADIIDFLPDATLVIDHEGRIIAWNHAIEEMTGYTAQEMIGRGNHEYALPFYGERRPILIDLVSMPREEIRHKYAHLQWDGGILTGEAHAPSLKGEARYLYATASALHDAQGNVVGAIETIRDITDRKHSEEELVKARASAEQANHAKSAFLANMSHELRTPLNAIIGFTRIVRRKADGVLPEKQTENLDKVLTSAEHLLNLINTVLDIAKIEAGRMDVIAANFRVAALIDLCANTAQPLLRPNVILEKEVDPGLSYVYSDQDKIRQIVLNLLSNAAKFTHEGCITLSAHKEGDNLHIAVRDTGIGISDDALPRIFKEFQQADSSTTRQYGGTGLGLSISRNLARLLGGDLNVDSELGKGSTFTLVIPAQYHGRHPSADAGTPGSSMDPGPVPVQPAEAHPGLSLAKKHLLVIDDDPDAVYLLQENLDRQEFEVVGTRSGEEGLHMARQQHPDAILLDIIMPGVDGWQVLNALKEDPATADIPVVLLTIVDKKALGFRLGAAAYLLKPLDPVAVRDALNRVIKNGHPQKHILVVDDDPTVADMLRQFLPESEFRLDAAVDGVAGLQAIEAERPDVLLLDLMMPRLDGFGVIERLRANPLTRDLPIIVISAKDLTAEESVRLKETVSFVMKKQGFEGDKLAEEINDAMRRGHRLPVSQA